MPSFKIPKQPLQKIALSCSGGGYRAASFHLGAMSYLNHLQFQNAPLLENVKVISTVSGGTITGMIYAIRKQRGESFDSIYHFILKKLNELDLVKEGLQKLSPEGKWKNQHKQKNLINAFAEMYDQHFTEEKTFAEFDSMRSHLEAVIFNSTEFDNGINFRFRNKGSGFFGNKKIQIPPQLASEIKLSDAMASSSCFTGGFEPMLWPQDFIHDKAPNLKEFSKSYGDNLGIMDGGIYDNQGIESILNHKKKNGETYFDLVIISDVASPYMKGYDRYPEKPKTVFRGYTLSGLKKRIRRFSMAFNAVILLLLLSLALIPYFTSYGYGRNWATGLCLGASTVLILVLVLKVFTLTFLNKKIQAFFLPILEMIPPFFRVKLSHLKIQNLSIGRLEPLIVDRINSVIILMMDVFLKVVRRLNYYKLYDDGNYKYRRITNLIQELTEKDYLNKVKRRAEDIAMTENYIKNSVLIGDYPQIIGAQIKPVIEEAASFGTTLWFTDNDQLNDRLNKLVASGQFTMCYNILEYLEILIFEEGNGYHELDEKTKNELEATYHNCKSDWDNFVKNPMFLL